jgi:hypothetical protein
MTQYLTINGRTSNDDDNSAGNPTGLGAGGFKTLWNQFVGDLLADQAAALQMSSLSNVVIGLGAKTFAPVVLRGAKVGMSIYALDASGALNLMFGTISAIDNVAETITINVTSTTGAGAIASWILQPSGPQGPQGAAGANGTNGINAWNNYTFTAGNITAANLDVVVANGAGAQTINLEAAPAAGHRIRVFHKNSGADVTVGHNGLTIDGAAADFTIDKATSYGRGFEFYYDGATWQVFLIGSIATA